MTNIRDKFSSIMGVRIQNNNWLGYINMLEREAHFNNVHRNELLVALGQCVEELQIIVKEQDGTISSLQKEVQDLLEFKKSFDPKHTEFIEETKVVDAITTKKRDTSNPVQPAKK